MASRLIFRSLSYFEFIFLCALRVCSNIIDLHVATSLPSTLAEEIVFSAFYILASFVIVGVYILF